MKIPTVNDANKILSESEKLNSGRWIDHARNTGLAAKLIAEKTKDINPESAYVLGLLHDVGRCFGIKQMSHILDGYKYMIENGYDDVARICLTHSFPLKNINTAIAKWDCSKEDFNFVQEYINTIEYNNYDKLIQICDYLSLPTGFTIIEKRMIDIILRYGTNDLMQVKFKEIIKIKEYFDNKVAGSIYDLLPNIYENTLYFTYTF